jgi:hypothetical protein
MANFCYTSAATDQWAGGIDLVGDAGVKMMLCNSTHVPDRDDDFVDDGGADDAIDGEIDPVTNYTGGFGGAGRKALASKSFVTDKTNDRAEFQVATPITWTALGGGVDDTITTAVVIKEVSVDTDSPVIAQIDTSSGSPSLPFDTNGSDLTLTPDAEGLIQLPTA